MLSDLNIEQQICFTVSDLLVAKNLNDCISVVDLAIDNAGDTLETKTASLSLVLANAILSTMNNDQNLHIPDISAQLALEISNTVEPLLVAYLTCSDLPPKSIEAFYSAQCSEFLSRTGGPNFGETAVRLTKSAIKFLALGSTDYVHSGHNQIKKGVQHFENLSKVVSLIRELPQRLRRQPRLLLSHTPGRHQQIESNTEKIAVVTLGLRLAEIDNLPWLVNHQNKVVIDFLNFPGIPIAFIDRMPGYFDATFAERVLLSCAEQLDISENQDNFFSTYSSFSYLKDQINNFANEMFKWNRIATAIAGRLKDQDVALVVAGHGLLIREKLLHIAIQNQAIPLVSIAHSGIDDPCTYVSKFPADVHLGWGPIDERILNCQHIDHVNFQPGLKQRITQNITLQPALDKSCVIVFLSPGQTGTTFVRVGPLQSISAIEGLFKLILDNPNISFALRFHPNYLDDGLIDWVLRNKPINSWIVSGLLTDVLAKYDFVLGFSLQIITTAIVDLAHQGIPVRHVLQGVELRKNLEEFIKHTVMPDLESMNTLLREISSDLFECRIDQPTMHLLSETFSGSINKLSDIRLKSVPVEITSNVTPYHDRNMDYIFWLSSRFPKTKFRKQWMRRPKILNIVRGMCTFPKFTIIRFVQAGIIGLDNNFKS